MSASFSGSLVDLPPVDVLQFLHLSRRSGVVHFEHRDSGHVDMALRNGKIVSAATSLKGVNLGSMLKNQFGVRDEAIERALTRQHDGVRRPVGALLVEQGDATQEQIEQAMVALIERLVQTVLTWADGRFDFELAEVERIDNVAHFPDHLCRDTEVDVEQLLMQAVKIFDEKGKTPQEETAPRTAPEATESTPKLPVPASAVVAAPAASPAPQRPPQADALPIAEHAPSSDATQDIERVGASLEDPSWLTDRNRTVVVISGDMLIKAALSARCTQEGWSFETFGVVQQARQAIGRLSSTDTDVVVVGDLGVRAPGNFSDVGSFPGLRRLRDEFPRVPVFLFGACVPDDQIYAAVRLGARRVLQRPQRHTQDTGEHLKERVARFVEELATSIHGTFAEARACHCEGSVMRQELRDVRDRVVQLRATDARTTVSLAVLEHVAARLERAVLFLRREKDLVCMGAFGEGSAGQPLTELAVGQPLGLDRSELVRRCIDTGTPYQGPVVTEPDFEPFFQRIGAPVNGDGLLLPITAMERTVALVYGDNGSAWLPLMTTYGLEILTCQAGLMLENLFLRRAWDRRAEKASSA